MAENTDCVKEAKIASDPALSGIGKRIKLIRKRLKMTQQELAGKEITRNMLSRIENGCALPSLSTLIYIAERLRVPCACLLDDTALDDHMRAELVRRAHEYMKSGEYAQALELVSESDIPADDELTLIIIECDLALAKSLTAEHKYFEAYQKLADASERTNSTIYSSAGSGYISSLYQGLAKRMLPLSKNGSEAPTPPDFDQYIDLYLYIRLLDFFDSGQIVKAVNLAAICEIGDRILSAHIAAKLDMANGRYAEAASKLRQIIESEKATPTPHGSLMLYRIYGDLEQCAKGENDYVLAYTYKEEKLKLYSLMSGIEL